MKKIARPALHEKIRQTQQGERRRNSMASTKTTASKTYLLEHHEQAAFVKWFRLQHKVVRIHSIPNSAARSVELAAYLKAEGLTKGVFDLQVPAWRTAIEFKRVKEAYKGAAALRKAVTPEQLDWENYYKSIGWTPIIAWGFQDAVDKIEELLNGGQ